MQVDHAFVGAWGIPINTRSAALSVAMSLEKADAATAEAYASGRATREKIHINRLDKEKAARREAALNRQKWISEQPLSFSNFFEKINWVNSTIVVLIPLIGALFLPFVPLQPRTAIAALIGYAMGGLGITAGYHRMWAHRAYDAGLPLRWVLMWWGSMSGQGSIKWWANGHRTHHRYTDTDKDPYNAKRGFWFSHLGWMVFKQNPRLKGRTDISDLLTDPLVKFQHQHYLPIFFLSAFVQPMLISGLGWGDWWGGLLYGGVVRLFFIHQATFCVNSLAHWIGEQPFDDRRTPRDHVLTALVTFGEGYHNFHHEFPSDYRNALKWYQYDPTKMFIWTMQQLGLAHNLQRFSRNVIEQGLVQQQQKKLDKWRSRLNWGVPIDQLPVIEFDDFKEQAGLGRQLVVISGIVHDVTDFVDRHPGGRALIKSAVGRDGTAVFNGGVYQHSNGAHNLLATMRVAVIRGGCEVEVWRKAHDERHKVIESDGKTIHRAGDQPSALKSVTGTPGA